MIRLVICDVDGTMLDETERIPDKIGELSELIKRKKVLFTIASGREYSQVEELERVLDIQIPIIMCNGTAARSRMGFVWCESIPGPILRELVERADRHGMTVVLSMPDGEFAYRKTAFVEQTIREYGRFGNILVPSGDGWDQVSVQKVLIIDKEHGDGYGEILKFLEEYGEKVTWVDFGDSIDVVPKGCTKASGVRRLSEKLGIGLEEIMALGDSYNDMEMLAEVGLGVAVNNAVDSLKARADYTCEGTYIDGVIEAIDKFC